MAQLLRSNGLNSAHVPGLTDVLASDHAGGVHMLATEDEVPLMDSSLAGSVSMVGVVCRRGQGPGAGCSCGADC